MSNEFKIKKGLIVKGEGGTVVDVQGESGQLFSVTDSLTGVLLSVNDITGIPILEVSSDDTVKMGPYSNPFIVNAVGLSVGTNLVLDSNGNVKFDGTPTTTNQNRGIYWTAYDKEGTTDPSDAAYIRHTTNSGGLAGSVLEISSQNDADDGVNFLVNSTASGVRINGNAILNASNFNSYSPTLTGGGASGTWSINVTGTAGSETLATVTGRGASTSTDLTFNGILTMGTGGTQYIRMGRFPASVTNTGEAWIGRASDRNSGTMTVQLGGNSSSGRQFEIVDYAWSVVLFNANSAGDVTASSSFRAPIFYDSNDTSYYLDPNSTGKSLNIAGNIDLIARSAGWAEGIRVRVPSTSTWGGIRFTRDRVNDDGNWAIGYTGIDSSDDLTFWKNNNDSGSMAARLTKGANFTVFGDIRAPIFYDSDNTAFFVDPNGNSVLTTATFNVNASSIMTLTSAGTNASMIKAGAGDELYLGGNDTWQMRFNGGNVLMDNGGYLQNDQSLRAPIFYDSANTAFFVDPASTSNLQGLTVAGSLTVSSNNATGGGIILADDGDIVDLNDAYCSMRFSSGVRIFSANRGGSPVITLGNNGVVTATTFSGNLSGNATTATTLQTARTIGGVSFNGSANIDLPGVNTSGNQNTSGNAATATEVVRTVAAGSEANLVSATIGDNDFFRIRTGGASNAGFAEIATADDGNEPIYVRQYTGTFTSLTRTATILDGSGNTSFPGNITAANLSGTNTGDQTNISGNAGTVTDGVYLSGTQTITGIKYFQSNLGGKLGSLANPSLQAYSTGNNSAFMSFHKSGVFAVNLGLDDDNVMRIGGWSAAADRWELNMSGDNTVAGSFRAPIFYDSANTAFYVDPASTSNLQGLTVTNTITGNITGNAATITSQANSATITAATSATANTIVLRDGNGYLFGNYINMTDDGNPGGGTSISSFITKQFDNYYRSVSPTNAMVSIRGVASGDWGINITGNAASVTNGVYTTGDQTIGGTKTFSSDIIVNSLRVGRGPGNSDFNTVVGFNTLRDNTSGSVNTAIGRNAAILNQGGSSNVAVGYAAGYSNVGGSNNISIGVNTMRNNNGGLRNVAIGNLSLYTSSGNNNVTVGFRAQTYDQRTNVVVVGYNTYVTANNHTVWGNSSNNSCNCVWTSWSNVSDCRDKTDIESLSSNLGLNLIRKLRPVKFKWDNRESYVRECRFEYGQKDGTLKGNKEHYGLIAQELKQVLDELDAKFDGLGHDGEKDAYRLTYEELLAPVIKSIQEIDEKLKEVERRFDRCKL
jgi:hypothetical protein